MLADMITLLDVPPLVYVAVVLTLTIIAKSWLQKSPANLPPCPVRPYPILGHIPYLKDKPRETLKDFRKKAGDVYSLYTGPKLSVVLNGYDVLKETLVKQADIFSDRPISLFNTIIKDADKGIFGASGHTWKEQRSVSLAILRNFGMGKNSLAEKIQEEVSAYMDELAKFKGTPQEVRTLTNVAVSNVICAIIVGKRFQYNDPYLIRLLFILDEQVKFFKTVSACNAFPWLRFLPGDLFKIKQIIKNNDDFMDHFCQPFIEQFSKKLEKGEEEEEESTSSFITSYLKEMKRKKDNGESTTMEVSQLMRIIQNLFAAGSETTSTTILWFMLYMLHYPDVQKKIFEEISDVVGTHRVVSLQDKSQLNYLNAAINETQRLASVAPLSFYTNTVEVNIRGYTVPAGTTFLPNLDSVLHDEKVWDDPMNFQPERFLDRTGNIVNPEEFLPFSLGRRVCLGESLAKMELFLFLSALVQRFQLLPATPNSLPSLKYSFGITCSPEAYKIRFVERKNV